MQENKIILLSIVKQYIYINLKVNCNLMAINY